MFQIFATLLNSQPKFIAYFSALHDYLHASVKFHCSCSLKAIHNFIRQSIPCIVFTFDSPRHSALTLGALIFLVALIMMPKKYWQSAAPARTSDASVSSSLEKNHKTEQGPERGRQRRRRVWWIVLAAAILLLALTLGLSLGLTLGPGHHGHGSDSESGPVVDLGYTSYQGSTYGDGVSQWLGIRYAAPPIGDLRFAAPQDPLVNSTLQRANKVCPVKQKPFIR